MAHGRPVWGKGWSERTCSVAALTVVGLCAWLPAHAVTLFQRSVYTTLDLAHCTTLKSTPDGTTYKCPGLPEVPVYFAEGDDRTFLSAGAALAKSRAAQQTLKSFNSVFPKAGGRATIEWRFVIRDNRKVPYAMIVRYFTEIDKAKGQVLVVSRVTDKDACHVAYIDARANPDAIVMARASPTSAPPPSTANANPRSKAPPAKARCDSPPLARTHASSKRWPDQRCCNRRAIPR
jgi:hypothetical protein